MAITSGQILLAGDVNSVSTSVDTARTKLGQAADTTKTAVGQLAASALFASIKANLTAANADARVSPKADLSTLINFEQGKLIYPIIFNNAQIAATTIFSNTCPCNCNVCACNCDRCSCDCDRCTHCSCDCDQCSCDCDRVCPCDCDWIG